MYRAGKEGTTAPSEPPAAEQDAPAEPQPTQTAGAPAGGSLYERAGATSVLDAAVELMYGKVQADETLAPFFEGMDMTRMQGHTVEYIVKIFGGPDDYFNDALKPLFAELVARGFTGKHYNVLTDYFAAALTNLEVDPSVIDEAILMFSAAEGEFLPDADDEGNHQAADEKHDLQ